MKAKRVIFIMLFPLIADLVVSCCNCLEPVIKLYTHKTILVSNLDNSGSQPVITTSNSVVKTGYGIRVQLNREKTVSNGKQGALFIQSAYAFDCDCPPVNQLLPKDSVTSIKIFTLNDFDATHSANADISDYFKVYRFFSFSTIKDYLKNSKSTLYEDSELELTLDLLLMTAPSINAQHKFKVQITLSDGRVLEQETSQIQLT
jgi:hypothetical protein